VASETVQTQFDLIARDRASRVFDRVGRSVDGVDSRSARLSRTLGRVGKVAAVGLVAGVYAGAKAFKFMHDEARESEKVTRLTESIIKSTGGAAKITAVEVARLAESISNKTGIDDEAIQTGSNLLLTFKNVRNELGKGNDIFNQATQAAVDLSAAGFGSIESASKMLGKALNDPIAGISALSRAGVTFTEQQREQIETLVESGNTLKAQKIIMKEVQSQVGGAAAATATGMDKLRVSIGNAAEKIGLQLLPYIDKAAAWLSDRLPGAIETASTFFGRLRDFIANQMIPKFRELGDFIVTNVIPKIQSLIGWVRDDLAPALKNFTNNVVPPLIDVLKELGAQFKNTGDDIEGQKSKPKAFGDSLTTMLNLVGPLVKARLKMMRDEIKGIGFAFEVSTFVVRTAAMKIAEHISDLVATAIGALVGLARAAGATADALGMDGLAAKLRGAADKMEDFKWKVQSALSGMGAAGKAAGTALGQGVAAGIAASSGMAVEQARQTVNRVNAMMRSTGEIKSPSKRTDREVGIPLAQGVAEGLRKGGKAAVEAAGVMVDKVVARLSSLREKAAGIRSSVGDSVKGIIDVSQFGAPVVIGQDAEGNDITRTPGVAETASGFASQARAFVEALRAMAAKKLAPSLIAAVAAAGPAGGLQAAQAFASASDSEIASVNASIGEINSLAAQAGSVVLQTAPLPAQIKREERMLALLGDVVAELRDAKANDEVALRITKGGDLIVEYVNDKNRRDQRRR
jgi:hypothetical protein